MAIVRPVGLVETLNPPDFAIALHGVYQNKPACVRQQWNQGTPWTIQFFDDDSIAGSNAQIQQGIDSQPAGLVVA